MMTLAEREELFRRFQEKSPSPQTELEYSSPYTLLVAVVLSAQATDVGVNKATGPLFAVADPPAKIVALEALPPCHPKSAVQSPGTRHLVKRCDRAALCLPAPAALALGP